MVHNGNISAYLFAFSRLSQQRSDDPQPPSAVPGGGDGAADVPRGKVQSADAARVVHQRRTGKIN